MKNSFNKGISIVEIVVASSIIAVCVVGIVGAIRIYLKIVHQNSRETQALLLLDETSEVLQYLRDKSYSNNIANLSLDTPYTIYFDGTDYQISSSSISLQYDIKRTFELKSVYRDNLDKISEPPGEEDLNTKKAIIKITWPYSDTEKIITSEILIHNTYEN